MKVYVMTEAKVMGYDVYKGIAKTKKEAEKVFRREYPHMRIEGIEGQKTTYASEAYDLHNIKPTLRWLHIYEEEL